MFLEIPDSLFENLVPQTTERAAERLVYNAADILKCIVHANVADEAVTRGYRAETKLALAHVLISLVVIAKQFGFTLEGITELADECVVDNRERLNGKDTSR